MKKIVIVFALLLVSFNLVYAQKMTLECFFYKDKGSYASWGKNEKFKFGRDTLVNLTFTITETNVKIIGNNGSADLKVLNVDKGKIDLLETTSGGNFMLTSIFYIEEQGWKIVHSRHTGLLGMVASQYYGDCKQID